MENRSNNSGALSPLMALRLAAPHTWAASVLPALFGGTLAALKGAVDLPMLMCLTMACVLMQSAVNTFNDYSDFVKGTDTLENSPEAEDAVMVYDKPQPKKVLALGFGFLLLAALFALPAVLRAGWRPLAVGAVGALAVLLYSFGKKPLSYLPLGELVSGFVMGGLIPLGVYGVLTDDFNAAVILRALPLVLGIALIMMTNNGCDIQRDSLSGRKTFAVMLGVRKTGLAYRLLLGLWLILPLPLCGRGAVFYLIALLSASGQTAAQLKLPLSPETRAKAMGGIVSMNVINAAAYIGALLFAGLC